MSRTERVLLGLLVVLAVVAGARAFLREEESPQAWGSPEVMFSPREQEAGALQAEILFCRERTRVQQAVIAELLAGQLTLREAAARFQEVDAPKPAWRVTCWRDACPGDTDEERYC